MEQRPKENNIVGGTLLPWTMRPLDHDTMRAQMDSLYGVKTGVRLAWNKEQTAEGCRKRDYGAGVPMWSPLYHAGYLDKLREQSRQAKLDRQAQEEKARAANASMAAPTKPESEEPKPRRPSKVTYAAASEAPATKSKPDVAQPPANPVLKVDEIMPYLDRIEKQRRKPSPKKRVPKNMRQPGAATTFSRSSVKAKQARNKANAAAPPAAAAPEVPGAKETILPSIAKAAPSAQPAAAAAAKPAPLRPRPGAARRMERTLEAQAAREAAAEEAKRTKYTGPKCEWATSRFEPTVDAVEECYEQNMSIRDRAAQAVPSWSPYTKSDTLDASKTFRTCMQDYGKPDKFSSVLTPSQQAKQARSLVRQMKGNACVDHTWELFGNRPSGIHDIVSHREEYMGNA
eukprot:CAMPEP_0118862746 /NCGR_PEP_ID=MMETSP1163-20130328/7847_1 /TAXON_ID=124430 /ORGANISM="Phaeomonas parva, Strain CCMP2877" /LENGTH=399 /DNA_ID=CAMNT_0006796677 /DNA_START=107 /DNA_END=1306 /DNA_ORIENTATION=+